MTKLEQLKSDVRESVRDQYDPTDQYPEDMAHEIAEGCVPIYNAHLCEFASDPEVFHYECELGPAFDGSPKVVNIIARAIYEILINEAHAEVARLIELAGDWGNSNIRERWVMIGETGVSLFAARRDKIPQELIEVAP